MQQVDNILTNDAYWQPPYKVACRCQECECDIYEGGEYFDFDGDIVCEDCERDYVRKNFRRVAE